MKVTNPDPRLPIDATRGGRSTNLAGAKGMIWRDASTESTGQIRDMTVIGAEFVDNDDGTGLLIIGGGGGGSGSGSGTYTQAQSDDLFLTRRKGEGHVVAVISASGSALTLDLSSANRFDITLSANCTLSFSNPPAAGPSAEWIIILRQDGTGSRTVTWPGSVKWQSATGTDSGSAPTLYTAATAEDVIVITTLDGGTSYGGSSERPAAAGVSALDDLSDVVITSVTAGDRLRYSGASWVNSALRWEPHVAYDGTVVLDGNGDPVMVEVA